MTEPASSTVAGIAAWKLGLFHKLAAFVATGVIGAMLIAAFDPPKNKRQLFLQALAAGVFSILFTPIVGRYAAGLLGVDLQTAGLERGAEVFLPVAFLIGATSWGLVGALSKLRGILRDRAAQALASRVGLND